MESDGQHRQKGRSGHDDGQKTRREPGTEVGQEWGGGTSLRKPGLGADTSTSEYVKGLDEEHGESEPGGEPK